MSLTQTAVRGASWLAGFKALSQVVSWGSTVIVTRLLLPEDYGLMEMATVLTGYIVLISEMGFGSAIVQRTSVSRSQLSSAFWFLTAWGVLMSFACWGLAGPTGLLFHSQETVPLTRAVGLIYLASTIMIVPRNILLRDLRFKALGVYEAAATFFSCLAMVYLAWSGAGVWTLIAGHIVREWLKALFFFWASGFRPLRIFCWREVGTLLGFGTSVAIANSFDYIVTKSDRFFCGRYLGEKSLGLYSLGLQLAQLATEKIVSLINSVAYPVLCRLQTEPERANLLFLKFVQLIAFVTGPLFIGIAVVSDDLLLVVFGERWAAAGPSLRLLCIAQLITAIVVPINSLNMSQGRPHWSMYTNALAALLMPCSFFLAVRFGLDYVAIPWITVMPAYRLVYVYLSLKKANINPLVFVKELVHPLCACFLLVFSVATYRLLLSETLPVYLLDCFREMFQMSRLFQAEEDLVFTWINLGFQVFFGFLGYSIYLLAIAKKMKPVLKEVWDL